MITIVDYGLGNIRAFENIYRSLRIPVSLAKTADQLKRASKIILPGVGAFDWAMKSLKFSGMEPTLHELVLDEKKPVLGVCVGMQMMARSSQEGDLAGLGWLDAKVKRFDDKLLDKRLPLPHMGWNTIKTDGVSKLFEGINDPTYYFLHSYYLEANTINDVIGKSYYGFEFASAVASGNIYATQFHPEKSHHWGIKLLKNFAENC
ncbi:imidazole glycerol phosphate synthase subunit HisH [Planktomarina temperata]|nr:imidazole glycerol phosphate synthase subunit HisH [Planktomarina temperata]